MNQKFETHIHQSKKLSPYLQGKSSGGQLIVCQECFLSRQCLFVQLSTYIHRKRIKCEVLILYWKNKMTLSEFPHG